MPLLGCYFLQAIDCQWGQALRFKVLEATEGQAGVRESAGMEARSGPSVEPRPGRSGAAAGRADSGSSLGSGCACASACACVGPPSRDGAIYGIRVTDLLRL